jgi:hypothetical protein
MQTDNDYYTQLAYKRARQLLVHAYLANESKVSINEIVSKTTQKMWCVELWRLMWGDKHDALLDEDTHKAIRNAIADHYGEFFTYEWDGSFQQVVDANPITEVKAESLMEDVRKLAVLHREYLKSDTITIVPLTTAINRISGILLEQEVSPALRSEVKEIIIMLLYYNDTRWLKQKHDIVFDKEHWLKRHGLMPDLVCKLTPALLKQFESIVYQTLNVFCNVDEISGSGYTFKGDNLVIEATA